MRYGFAILFIILIISAFQRDSIRMQNRRVIDTNFYNKMISAVNRTELTFNKIDSINSVLIVLSTRVIKLQEQNDTLRTNQISGQISMLKSELKQDSLLKLAWIADVRAKEAEKVGREEAQMNRVNEKIFDAVMGGSVILVSLITLLAYIYTYRLLDKKILSRLTQA